MKAARWSSPWNESCESAECQLPFMILRSVVDFSPARGDDVCTWDGFPLKIPAAKTSVLAEPCLPVLTDVMDVTLLISGRDSPV